MSLYTTRWRRTRVRILERDGYVCHWCGGRATEADHLKSRAEGGAMFDPRNLVASCKPCNVSRGNELKRQRANGKTLGSRRYGDRFFRGREPTHPACGYSQTQFEVVQGAIRD